MIEKIINRLLFTSRKNLIADMRLACRYNADLMKLYLSVSNDQINYYKLLFAITLAANPSVVLELGTGPGLSSLAFARVIKYYRNAGSKNGVLHTCDMNPLMIEKLRRNISFGDIIIPHAVSTDELALQWAESRTLIDILYIDACHSFEQSLLDFKNFSYYVQPNGMIIMHDTFPLTEEHEQQKYSGDAWKTPIHIKNNYSDDYEVMTIPYLCGICLLRKKGSKYF